LFGLVATVGTTYVLIERLTWLSTVMGAAAGCLACALLVINNLRDRPSDAAAGKRTLAVRIGDAPTRTLYIALLVTAFVCVAIAARWRPWVLLAFGAAPLAAAAAHVVRRGAIGRDLIVSLVATGRVQLTYGAFATLGLVLSR